MLGAGRRETAMATGKKAVAVFILLLMLIPAIPYYVPAVSAQDDGGGSFGNPEIPPLINFTKPTFRNAAFGFTHPTVNMTSDFSIVGALWDCWSNDTYCIQTVENPAGTDHVSLIWEWDEALGMWKLSIQGYTSRNRSFNLRFAAANTTINGTRLTFNNQTYFDWGDSPSYFTYLGLQNGVYRVRLTLATGGFNIDPSFGSATIGGSSSRVDIYWYGGTFLFTGGNGYQADCVWIALYPAAYPHTGKVNVALYSTTAADGNTGTLVAQTQSTIVYYFAAKFFQFNFSSPPALTNNTYYTIAVSAEQVGGVYIYVYYASVSGYYSPYTYASFNASGFPSTISWGGVSANRERSYYCNYSLAVAADSTPPTYSNTGHNSTQPGQPCLFYCKWLDETNLTVTGGYIFETNNTGVWANESWVAFTANPAWINATKTLNATRELYVGYRFYANDTAGNPNNTGILSLQLNGWKNSSATIGIAAGNPASFAHSSSLSPAEGLAASDSLAGTIHGTSAFATGMGVKGLSSAMLVSFATVSDALAATATAAYSLAGVAVTTLQFASSACTATASFLFSAVSEYLEGLAAGDSTAELLSGASSFATGVSSAGLSQAAGSFASSFSEAVSMGADAAAAISAATIQRLFDAGVAIGTALGTQFSAIQSYAEGIAAAISASFSGAFASTFSEAAALATDVQFLFAGAWSGAESVGVMIESSTNLLATTFAQIFFGGSAVSADAQVRLDAMSTILTGIMSGDSTTESFSGASTFATGLESAGLSSAIGEFAASFAESVAVGASSLTVMAGETIVRIAFATLSASASFQAQLQSAGLWLAEAVIGDNTVEGFHGQSVFANGYALGEASTALGSFASEFSSGVSIGLSSLTSLAGEIFTALAFAGATVGDSVSFFFEGAATFFEGVMVNAWAFWDWVSTQPIVRSLFATPTIIYRGEGFDINCTVTVPEGSTLANVTIALSNGIHIFFDHTTESFQLLNATGWIMVSNSTSFHTHPNATSTTMDFKLLTWADHPVGQVNATATAYTDNGGTGALTEEPLYEVTVTAIYVEDKAPFATYALIFGLAVVLMILSLALWGRGLSIASIVFPVGSGISWIVVAVQSFTMVPNRIVSAGLDYVMAPVAVAFALLMFLLALYNVFRLVQEASDIRIDEYDDSQEVYE